jgi:hypothetical protein
MFENIAFYGQVISAAVIVLIGLSWLWSSVIKPKLPTSTNTTVIGVVDKVSAYADEAAAWTALQTAAMLFKKHGDKEAATTIASLSSKLLLWDDVEVK